MTTSAAAAPLAYAASRQTTVRVANDNEPIIVDLFAGGGGASEAIRMVTGRDPDVAVNHDQNAIDIHTINHPLTRHYRADVREVDPVEACTFDGVLRKVGLLWASPDCFPAGTMVLTSNGYRPIETIRKGDRVLTHTGAWRKVTDTMSTVRPLMTIRGHGHPGLVVSPEHPFYARRKGGEPGWVNAEDMERGLYWATPTKFPALGIPEIKGDRPIARTDKLMWLAGRYLGDGWSRADESRAELVIVCGSHEADELGEHLNSLWPAAGARAGAGELRWSRRDVPTGAQFSTSHRGLVMWLRDNFGHGAADKSVPGWAMGMAPDLRSALLEGYLSADGYKSETFWEAETVSRALAYGMKAVAESLGNTVCVYLRQNSDHIQGRKVNSRPIYKLRARFDVDAAHRQTWREDHLEWAPIRATEDLGDIGEVFNISVEEDESYVVEGIVVHNCTHFSKARGGKPVSKGIRSLADVVLVWAAQVRPAVIALENVEEFKDWGPVLEDGKPCPQNKGLDFRRWVKGLEDMGYVVEWRELVAADYGAPTTRKRLFLIARCDGRPIAWPVPKLISRKALSKADLFETRKEIWRSAAEHVIDWTIPVPSIFGRKKGLAPKTHARIFKGIKRFMIERKPYIVPITHSGPGRVHSVDDPTRTVTSAHRGEFSLIEPKVEAAMLQKMNQNGVGPHPTVMTDGGGGKSGVVAAYMAQGNDGRVGREARDPVTTLTQRSTQQQLIAAALTKYFGTGVAKDMLEPADTTTTKARFALSTAYLEQANTGMVGHAATEPVSTIVGKGCTQRLTEVALEAIGAPQGSRRRQVLEFLWTHAGVPTDEEWLDPLATEEGRLKFGLVEVDGEIFQIVDIGMRMLTPRELFNAQGFRRDYVIDITLDGRPITKTAQTRMAGNSVSPPPAAALLDVNLPSEMLLKAAA